MTLVRCENGHYFNDEESKKCPYCNGKMGPTITLGADPQINQDAAEFGKTLPLGTPYEKNEVGDFKSTQPPKEDYGGTRIKDGIANSEIRPVRGWLVVIKGKKMGADFRIHAGENTIGRSSSNSIHFDFDMKVASENACSIAYDERHNKFYMTKGKSINIVYVNNEPLKESVYIKDNDIIEIGETVFIFRSLCNETFNYIMDGDDVAK